MHALNKTKKAISQKRPHLRRPFLGSVLDNAHSILNLNYVKVSAEAP